MRLIDADKLMSDIEHYHLSDGKFQHWVEIQPTVESESKKGKWIFPYETTTMVSICSECGAHGRGNFCPNCGADMREKKAE